MPARLRILAVQPLLPHQVRVQVEDHQAPGFRPNTVHVCGRVFPTLADQATQATLRSVLLTAREQGLNRIEVLLQGPTTLPAKVGSQASH